MWGKKEETLEPISAPAAVEQQKFRPLSRPSSSSSTPAAAPSRGQGTATIGKSLKVKGTLGGHEDVYVDGEVEGNIELEENTLTVGPNGNINADVKAKNITVLGRLTGNVFAGERIEIRKTGSLEGDVTSRRIVIEDGAVFRGSIDIVKPEPAPVKLAPKETPALQEATGPKLNSTPTPKPMVATEKTLPAPVKQSAGAVV